MKDNKVPVEKNVIKHNTSGEIFFFCPACEYAHKINDTWEWNKDLVKPTFSPSILVTGMKRCHSYVRDGKIEYLSDCDHTFAGKTVELEPFGDN